MTEQQMQLPEGWSVIQLSDVLDEFETGTRPKGGVSGYTEGVPSLGAEHLDNEGGFKFEKIKFVPNEFASSMKRGHLQREDILVVKDGATTGKTSILGCDFPYNKAVINEHVFRCKVNKSILSKYAFYYLFSNKGKQEILSDFRGAAQGGISKGFTQKVNIPLPRLDTQKQIVSKIEELFSHIDAGIKSLKISKEKLKQYRQSVLKAAVTGELTKDWRQANQHKIEPADQLLQRILKERRQRWEQQQLDQFAAKGQTPKNDKWKEKYKEPEALSNVKGFTVPESWVVINFDIAIIAGPQNGIYLPKSKYGQGVPIIRIDDYQDDYVKPYSELQKVDAVEKEIKLYGVSENDLIINRVNSMTHIGKCMVVQSKYIPAVFESNMMKLSLSTLVDVEYFELFINSKLGRQELIKNAKQAVNQASINQQDVKNTRIGLPPLNEQKEIVRIVEEKLSAADRLMTEIDTKLTQVQQQKQTILGSAFKGKLV